MGPCGVPRRDRRRAGRERRARDQGARPQRLDVRHRDRLRREQDFDRAPRSRTSTPTGRRAPARRSGSERCSSRHFMVSFDQRGWLDEQGFGRLQGARRNSDFHGRADGLPREPRERDRRHLRAGRRRFLEFATHGVRGRVHRDRPGLARQWGARGRRRRRVHARRRLRVPAVLGAGRRASTSARTTSVSTASSSRRPGSSRPSSASTGTSSAAGLKRSPLRLDNALQLLLVFIPLAVVAEWLHWGRPRRVRVRVRSRSSRSPA